MSYFVPEPVVKIFTRPCRYCNKIIMFDSRVKSRNNYLVPLNVEDRSIHDHPEQRGIIKYYKREISQRVPVKSHHHSTETFKVIRLRI
jgi:hypothetical protein